MTLAATIGTMLVVALAASSLAATDPLTDCNDNPDPAAQIRGCTEYIGQGNSDPHNLAIAHVNRAIAHIQIGQPETAFADLAAAIKLDPHSPLAFYNRGNLYLDTGRHNLAVADFTSAIAVEPLFALAYYNRGLAYEQQGDSVAAKADYQRTLALDPSHEDARNHLDSLQATIQN